MDMTDSYTSVKAPLAKSASAWTAAGAAKGVEASTGGGHAIDFLQSIGITSWAEAASFVAFLYTLILMMEWSWKRFVRPFLEARGVLKRQRRRREDRQEETDDLGEPA